MYAYPISMLTHSLVLTRTHPYSHTHTHTHTHTQGGQGTALPQTAAERDHNHQSVGIHFLPDRPRGAGNGDGDGRLIDSGNYMYFIFYAFCMGNKQYVVDAGDYVLYILNYITHFIWEITTYFADVERI